MPVTSLPFSPLETSLPTPMLVSPTIEQWILTYGCRLHTCCCHPQTLTLLGDVQDLTCTPTLAPWLDSPGPISHMLLLPYLVLTQERQATQSRNFNTHVLQKLYVHVVSSLLKLKPLPIPSSSCQERNRVTSSGILPSPARGPFRFFRLHTALVTTHPICLPTAYSRLYLF